jgi:DNA-binding protein YbaB
MDYNKAKELLKLQQEAKKIQNELELTHIESEVDGIVVTITGALTCHEVKFE